MRVQGNDLQEKGQFAYVFDTLAFSPGRIYTSPISVNHEYGAHSAPRASRRCGSARRWRTRAATVVGVVVIDIDLAGLLQAPAERFAERLSGLSRQRMGRFPGPSGRVEDLRFRPGPARSDAGQFLRDQAAVRSVARAKCCVNGLARPRQAAGQVLAFVRRPFGGVRGQSLYRAGSRQAADGRAVGRASAGRQHRPHGADFQRACRCCWRLLFARAVTKPLHILAYAATHLFAEHAMHTLPLKRTDEIGVLARCFDRLRREIKAQMDVLHNKQRELVHLATHDVLTGLPNRMLFMQKLESAIERGDAARGRACRAVRRSRPLQADQRPVRSLGRRQGARRRWRAGSSRCSVQSTWWRGWAATSSSC